MILDNNGVGQDARPGESPPASEAPGGTGGKAERGFQNRTPMNRLPMNRTYGANPPSPSVFEVRCRTGIWEVVCNKAFYGDFLNRSNAMEAVEAGIAAIRRAGGEASLHERAPAAQRP